jgi:tRNA (mo5U34)-methyltransferase
VRGPAVEKGEKLSLRGIFSDAPCSHLVNQRHKEQVLIPFTQQALDNLTKTPHCLELFCSDGYYGCMIAHLQPGAVVTGVDLDPQEIQRAQSVARLLGISDIRFVVADVWEYVRQAGPYDLVLCTGGLYHLREPRRFLEMLHAICGDFLVVQSVVTLETEDPKFFLSPAPGWQHGSRFTHAGLRRWLLEIGWNIVQEERNELTGNPRRCDRGSSYFLCRRRVE